MCITTDRGQIPTRMQFSIVPMISEAEINGKGYVHWKSWHETYTGLVDPGYMDKVTLQRCIEMAHRWPQNTLVAKDGDQVIGLVCYGQSETPDLGEIFAIYVLADYYGQKVGYELMNAAFEKLSVYPKIVLWVLKGNQRAIRFYGRYGFHPDGAQKDIKLGTPNTELRMIYERE